jgi:hypothetical protein
VNSITNTLSKTISLLARATEARGPASDPLRFAPGQLRESRLWSLRLTVRRDRSKFGEGAAIVRQAGRTAVRPYDQWYAATRVTKH